MPGVKLTDVNPELICVLCHGYFIDATAIKECLHSFCRSCIILYLEAKNYCPKCQVPINTSKPHLSLKPDKTRQDIVYKLVPGLFHSEMRRRREFYKKHCHRDMHLHPEARGVDVDRLIYSPEDSISLSLEYYDSDKEKEEWSSSVSGKEGKGDKTPVASTPVTSTPGIGSTATRGPESSSPTIEGAAMQSPNKQLQERNLSRKRYLQCPAEVSMRHLKKFIRMKYELPPEISVELFYKRESLPDDYSLMDIAYIYTWKRNGPMRFYYRIHIPTPISNKDIVIKEPSVTTIKLDAAPSVTPEPPAVPEIKVPSMDKTTIPQPETILGTEARPNVKSIVPSLCITGSHSKGEREIKVTESSKPSLELSEKSTSSAIPSPGADKMNPGPKSTPIPVKSKSICYKEATFSSPEKPADPLSAYDFEEEKLPIKNLEKLVNANDRPSISSIKLSGMNKAKITANTPNKSAINNSGSKTEKLNSTSGSKTENTNSTPGLKVEKPSSAAGLKTEKPISTGGLKVDKPNSTARLKVEKPNSIADLKADKPNSTAVPATAVSTPPSTASSMTLITTVPTLLTPDETRVVVTTPSNADVKLSTSSKVPVIGSKPANGEPVNSHSLIKLANSVSKSPGVSVQSAEPPAVAPKLGAQKSCKIDEVVLKSSDQENVRNKTTDQKTDGRAVTPVEEKSKIKEVPEKHTLNEMAPKTVPKIILKKILSNGAASCKLNKDGNPCKPVEKGSAVQLTTPNPQNSNNKTEIKSSEQNYLSSTFDFVNEKVPIKNLEKLVYSKNKPIIPQVKVNGVNSFPNRGAQILNKVKPPHNFEIKQNDAKAETPRIYESKKCISQNVKSLASDLPVKKPVNGLRLDSPRPPVPLTNNANSVSIPSAKKTANGVNPPTRVLNITSNSNLNQIDAQKRKRNELERCIETENGCLSVSLLSQSQQEIEAKKMKMVEPDVSIQLMSFSYDKQKLDGSPKNNSTNRIALSENPKSKENNEAPKLCNSNKTNVAFPSQSQVSVGQKRENSGPLDLSSQQGGPPGPGFPQSNKSTPSPTEKRRKMPPLAPLRVPSLTSLSAQTEPSKKSPPTKNLLSTLNDQRDVSKYPKETIEFLLKHQFNNNNNKGSEKILDEFLRNCQNYAFTPPFPFMLAGSTLPPESGRK